MKRDNYTNAEMEEVLEVLFAHDVAIEHVRNLAADLPRDYEMFRAEKAEAEVEAAWEEYNSAPISDETYRRQMTDAGRGHLLK